MFQKSVCKMTGKKSKYLFKAFNVFTICILLQFYQTFFSWRCSALFFFDYFDMWHTTL